MKFSAPHLLAAAALAVSTLAQAQLSPPYSRLYVFGDSLSDSGNNFVASGFLTGPAPSSPTFIPSLPFTPGVAGSLPTYSNGPTWVSSFAAGLGLSAYAAPSLIGGGNYASGGARTTGGSLFPPALTVQLNSYLGSFAGSVPAGSLYVLAGGGNDARAVADAIAGGADPTAATVAGASSYASTTLGMVNQLKARGATNIIVWNVPDLGKTPAALAGGPASSLGGTQISSTFNSFLSGTLAGSGVTIFDTFGIIQSVVASPATFGFTNVTQACGFAGNGCNPASALFWDGIHPTAFAQTFIANRMLVTAVPEPATYALFALGVAGLGVAVRRRKAAAAQA